MVDTVHILIQPLCMQNPMTPVEYKIFEDEVEYYLHKNYFPA